MIYPTYEAHSLTLPIPTATRTIAEQFASEQPTPERAEQVRRNTIAVLVVQDYLQLMDIPTSLMTSDSWNPVTRLMGDVADLMLPGQGRLECRPVPIGARTCLVPPETWNLDEKGEIDHKMRLGYVSVQFDPSTLKEATIVGFLPSVVTEEVELASFQPIETLLETLAGEVPKIGQTLVNLGHWLQDQIDEGWQTIDSLFNNPALSPAFAFRGVAVRSPEAIQADDRDDFGATQRRAKLIDLGIQAGTQVLALIVELRPEAEQQTGIRIQLRPTQQPYLPEDIRLVILDQTGTIFGEVQARANDNYIQWQFSGLSSERFTVQIQLEDAQVMQEFVI